MSFQDLQKQFGSSGGCWILLTFFGYAFLYQLSDAFQQLGDERMETARILDILFQNLKVLLASFFLLMHWIL